MKAMTIGNFHVDRVVEMEGPWAELDFILPNCPPDILIDNRDWLEPHFIEPGTAKAVMSFHSYIIHTGRYTILVDSCGGNDKERPARPIWHRQQRPYLDRMAECGVHPEQIDFVFCTHLHADHVGWNTRLQDGRWVPTFPNAKYLFHSKEYEFWEQSHREALAKGLEAPNHGSFADSVLPVMDAGLAELVGADHEIDHGVRLEAAYGHTPGACFLNVRSSGQHAVFIGDAMHTAAQLADPSLSSCFCWDPELSAEVRTELCERYADTSSRIFTAHLPAPSAYRIVGHRNGFKAEI